MMMPVVMPMMVVVPVRTGDRRHGDGERDDRRENVT
jgi:hypothetical protein